MSKPIVYRIFLLVIVTSTIWLAGCQGEKPSEPPMTDIQSARQSGLQYLGAGKLTEAELEFKKLIELAPEEVMGYANLGIVYFQQNKLDLAEEFLLQGLKLDENNVAVRLNLFDVYERLDRQEAAQKQLERILQDDPNNLFALYKLSEGGDAPSGDGSLTGMGDYLARIITLAPTNIVPRIFLIEHLLESKQYDQALVQFEDISSKFERLPEGSAEAFDKAYERLRNSNFEEAYAATVVFHNQLKLTNWYQGDILALKGSEESRIGTPIISFSRKISSFSGDQENQVYQNIRFVDVAENAGLKAQVKSTDSDAHPSILVNDVDNDGDQDLLFASGAAEGGGLHLFSSEFGRFDNVINESGIQQSAQVQELLTSDFDNDGFLDLLVIYEGLVQLYRNVDELSYQDITNDSGLSEISGAVTALSFDADHDGDLDLFIGTDGVDKLLQNNGHGVFVDVAERAGIGNHTGITHEAVFGDFDDDGDTDFFIANESGNRLYANYRSGNFQEVGSDWGLDPTENSHAVSSGDYNNDGLLDLFVTNSTGSFKLYKNDSGQGFEEELDLSDVASLKDIQPADHRFIDFDNDGYLDLIIAGRPTTQTGRGLVILRNNQTSSFEDVSWVLPESNAPVKSLAVGDYNEDSDLDLFVGYQDGSLGLLRNDGGNMNYQLKLKLVGLREGSGKNNFYGIGSKVEVVAGALYQTRTITSPNEYLGLGNNERADILRVRWTNGVPQNIFAPNSDLDLIEQQKLKGSCPFLYTWNGEEYQFVKDMMWRSALGMPLGIMTSDNQKAYAFPNASEEYLRIPGEYLKADQGVYKIKITGELWETIYLDQLALFAVDRPKNIDFRLDEKFVLPPFPKLNPYTIKSKNIPVAVTDGTHDLLDKVQAKDNSYIDNFKRSKYQGITELTRLVIDLGSNLEQENLHLFLNGWIFPSDASINLAVSQDATLSVVPPYLEVLNKQGEWEVAIENLGFPLGKNKTVVTDLSNVFHSDQRKVRISTNMQIYWDHIYYDHVLDSFPGTITPMVSSKANLDYRGFSQEFRKGHRNGPHWFDYAQTSTEPHWADLEGFYTRYGDVQPLLTDADNQYIVYNAGDEVTISYDAHKLPSLPAGWTRDFIIYSVGWVKDGDLNTATGQTVEPLPFHGMSSYPYPDTERYPYELNAAYLSKYHTRRVSPQSFQSVIKPAQ